MNRYLAGAIGGTLATLPMTVAMVALFRHLPRDERYPLPPREITQDIMQKAGQDRRLNENQRTGLSLLAHFAYGTLTGALYPLTCRRVKRPALYGSGYGLAVWAASYLGWIPAFNILPPATRQPAHRRYLMIGVHLIWGAGTVLIGERLIRHHRAFAQHSSDDRITAPSKLGTGRHTDIP